ncbi:hypothetical protein CEXT_529371 [Caerostris extrusa]|uniref:Secreted protein n=1 Tax=Caerostris extrusa TaxID=172846 RepID=A0AAV4TR96_CAEEX|nr:hypothetical protein CEXT_529371 [Caerostris extrusa]
MWYKSFASVALFRGILCWRKKGNSYFSTLPPITFNDGWFESCPTTTYPRKKKIKEGRCLIPYGPPTLRSDIDKGPHRNHCCIRDHVRGQCGECPLTEFS